MEKSMPALEIENLHHYYRGNWLFGKFHALKGLNLTVNQGEFFGFLGHNGGGKTTTIKCVLGLLTASQGSIKIFGVPHNKTNARERVGYVPEHPYFYDHLTVRELVEMYAHLAGVEKGKLKGAVTQSLNMLGMSGRSKSPMRSLSKGLTQRVAMAQAIVASPKLLLLDEPFSGLDPLGRREIKDLLAILKETGTTIFISSHIISDIESLCDRASILVRGELKGVYDIKNASELRKGNYELVIRDFDSIRNQISKSAIDVSSTDKVLKLKYANREEGEQALGDAIKGGAHIDSFQFIHNSLEDVFVALARQDSSKA